jgi:hypothetical protein
LVCRKAACVYPRGLTTTQQQPALARRSNQSSRRMFGRRVAETVGPEIVLRMSRAGGNREKRYENSCRQTGKAFGHAERHQDAFVAADWRRSLRRTAGHIIRHRIGRCRRGHILRHCRHRRVRHRCIRHRAGHDRPGQRSQDQTRDHEDREQPADGDLVVHASKSHRCVEIESLSN